MNPRSSLFSGVLSAAVVAAVVGFLILQRFAPEAALARAFVDGGLLVLLALVVYSFTRTPAHRVDDLADAIVELTRGNRSRRLDPAEYGELEPIARAFNDIAAHLSAQEDPNLGPIKRRPRLRGAGGEDSGPQSPPTEAENPDASMRIRNLSDLAKNHSYHPELGPVRVMTADAGAVDSSHEAEPEHQLSSDEPLADATPVAAADDELAAPSPDAADEVAGDAKPAAGAESERNSTLRLVTNEYSRNGTESPHSVSQLAPAASREDSVVGTAERTSNDTDIDALLEASNRTNGSAVPTPNGNLNDSSVREAEMGRENGSGLGNVSTLTPRSASTPPQLSDGERMRALFDAFVQAKQEHEEPTEDLEFNSFAAMVMEERVKLRQTHECRDVRFEVTVKAGEVSLLPRLLR